MEKPIIEMTNVTMRFKIQKRHYGFKNIILHLPQYIRDRKSAAEFTALDYLNLKIYRGPLYPSSVMCIVDMKER